MFAAGDSGGVKTWNQPKPSWRAVPNNTDLQEPGWTPRTLQYPPRHHPVINIIQHQQQQQQQQHRQYPHPVAPPVRHTEEVPAWYGSLRSATDPRLSDRKVCRHFCLLPPPTSLFIFLFFYLSACWFISRITRKVTMAHLAAIFRGGLDSARA